MHSYQILAVLALAASTASPALSAPVLENRAPLAPVIPPLFGGLNTVGFGAGVGAPPSDNSTSGNSTSGNCTSGNSTRRDTPVDLSERAPTVGSAVGSIVGDVAHGFEADGGLGKALSGGLGAFTAAIGALEAAKFVNITKREPISLSEFSGLGKTLAGTLVSLAAATGVQDLFGSNSTLKRSFSLSNITGFAGDVLGSVGASAIADELEGLLGARDDASPRDLIDALQLLSRRIDELD